MTQDERWMKNYQEVMDFIKTNKRNPSKYEPEEKAMVNWQKQQRKLNFVDFCRDSIELKLAAPEVAQCWVAKAREGRDV